MELGKADWVWDRERKWLEEEWMDLDKRDCVDYIRRLYRRHPWSCLYVVPVCFGIGTKQF